MMVVFEKPVPLRHIGHLDLMRTVQRALRRSKLPVRYSRGFNPHIKLSFASPLSVGTAGEREIMDVSMDGECGTEGFLRQLNPVMPGGMKAVFAREIDDSFPTLMGLAAGSRYRIELDVNVALFADAVTRLRTSGEYQAVRKTKSGEAVCDILPYIHTLEIKGNAVSFTALNLQSGSLRPSVVMEVLFALSGMEPCGYTAIREAILAKDAQGNLVPLEGVAHDG